MPIPVTCDGCGADYKLKDEFAGKRVKCPKCQTVIDVPLPAPPPPPPARKPAPPPVAEVVEDDEYDYDTRQPIRKPVARPTAKPAYVVVDEEEEEAPADQQLDPEFDRDKFLLRQKLWTIKEKYSVTDEDGEPLLYVERPIYLAAGCLAMFVGILVMAVIGAAAVALAVAVKGDAGAVVGIILGIVGFLLGLVVIIALYPKRHVEFYFDERMRHPVLKVLQDKKFILINMTYTLLDEDGEVLARFRKNYLHNIFRKRWYVYRPDGELWFVVKEDSIILSMLRRTIGVVLDEIPLLGLALAAALRTNFVFLRPDDEEQLGMFNRRLTLLDRYVLDMSDDPDREIDRRVAVAMGVLLDTGERR